MIDLQGIFRASGGGAMLLLISQLMGGLKKTERQCGKGFDWTGDEDEADLVD